MKRFPLVLCLLLLFPAVAQAGPVLDGAVECLRSQPVCVQDGRLSRTETAAVKREIERTIKEAFGR